MINFDRRQPALPEDEIGITINGSAQASLIRTVSEGMEVKMASPLRPGTQCTINVPTRGDELRLRGRVYRCQISWSTADEEGAKPKATYVATIEFVDISKIELEVLMALVGDEAPEPDEPGTSWLRSFGRRRQTRA